jgi:Zn-dependent protease
MTNVSLPGIIISIPVFIFAIVIHEVAHGWVAYRLGDSTAKHLGRLTLNPISHIDPIGTVALPIMLMIMNSPVVFGWAKPVPINFLNLRNPKKDIIYVGLAGPLANIIFAFILAALLRLFPAAHSPVFTEVVFLSILVNLVLAAFNLIPLPPLDGSRILFGLLPARLAVKYMSIEKYGFIILFILLWLGFIDWFINPIVAILAKIIGA